MARYLFKFSPQRNDSMLTLAVNGEAIIINGERVDMSGLTPGSVLPEDAIDSPEYLFWGELENHDGLRVIRIVLPIGPGYTQEQAFPEDVFTDKDGEVKLP